MAPKPKFTKEQLIDVAFDIATEEGFDSITIRNVATRLGCSIAPIYVNFEDVEELKQEVVLRAIAVAEKILAEQNSGDLFLDIGVASVVFAKKYPLLFDEVVIKRNNRYIDPDQFKEFAINQMKKDPELAQFDDFELELLLLKMKAFQGGLSLLARNEKYADILTDELVITLLDDTGNDILSGMKKRNCHSRHPWMNHP